MFDIAIPTWNSLEYLQICVKGIQQNSALPHRIIVHNNGSTDGTKEWLQAQGIELTSTPENKGFCGVNYALRQVTADHVMVMNSDMYPLPGWDLEINKQINLFKRIGLKAYTISSCLIEPTGFNPEYDIENCGTTAENFDEDKLLKHFKSQRHRYYSRKDTVQYSHPILLPTSLMERIGYFDPEYFPGWACDHDLAARAWYRGECRHFVMLGKSRVYHFSSKTFKKLPPEIQAQHGEDLFYNKWNVSVPYFRQILGVAHNYVQPAG